MITDWGTLGLGVWVDDATVTVGSTSTSTDFEADERRLAARALARGHAQNPVVGWERVTEEFQEGPVVATDDTVYTGFGFEGISVRPSARSS